MHTHFTQLYIAGNFPYLNDVIRIIVKVFISFAILGQSQQSLTKCYVFSNFQMSCITMYSFENQSCQVQLITLKATYLPNILPMRVNLLPT